VAVLLSSLRDLIPLYLTYPGLTSWANICRRSAAGVRAGYKPGDRRDVPQFCRSEGDGGARIRQTVPLFLSKNGSRADPESIQPIRSFLSLLARSGQRLGGSPRRACASWDFALVVLRFAFQRDRPVAVLCRILFASLTYPLLPTGAPDCYALWISGSGLV
jgi:hypothetical protein